MSSTIQSLVQSLLALVGGYLVMRGVDATVVSTAIGIVLGIVSVVWGIISHNPNGNSILSVVTNLSTFVAGILVANGKLSTTNAQTYIGLIVGLAASILSAFHISTTAASVAAANAAKSAPKNGQVTKN